MRRVKRRSRARPRLTPLQAAMRAIETLIDCPHLLTRSAAWLESHLTREGDDALLAHWRRHIAAPVLAGRCSFCGCYLDSEALAALRAENRIEQDWHKMFEHEERE